MTLITKPNWEFRTNISWNLILQAMLIFLASIFINSCFSSKPGTFHVFDGLILFLFLYINYIPRFKVNLSHQHYDTELDLLFLTFITLEIVLFIGLRKLDLGFNYVPGLFMWLETFMLSLVWISGGVLVSVKMGFVKFAGWWPGWRKVLRMIVFIFIMALLEEIFFRGFLFNYLKQISGNIFISFGLSTLVFGLAHYKKRGLAMVLMATLAGIFYGLTYILTGSIYCATFIHFATNTSWLIFFTNNNPLQKRI